MSNTISCNAKQIMKITEFFLNCNIDPACQSISTELQCYVREPYCTAKSNTDESSDQNNVTLIMIIVGAIVLITSCIGIILCYKRRQANGNKRKLNNIHDLFYL